MGPRLRGAAGVQPTLPDERRQRADQPGHRQPVTESAVGRAARAGARPGGDHGGLAASGSVCEPQTGVADDAQR